MRRRVEGGDFRKLRLEVNLTGLMVCPFEKTPYLRNRKTAKHDITIFHYHQHYHSHVARQLVRR